VKRADALAVLDREEAGTAVYDVVLLAGSPRRLVLRLAAELARESLIEVDGAEWLVADVRRPDKGPAQLICIYAD
jgi:hypothetical protein